MLLYRKPIICCNPHVRTYGIRTFSLSLTTSDPPTKSTTRISPLKHIYGFTIDGSRGEGGGQLLRNAITYAAIFRKGLRVNNVRKHRVKPGLNAQHVVGLQLAANICGGKLTGDQLFSKVIHYAPTIPPLNTSKSFKQRILVGDTTTAGSVVLLLQAALPCVLLGTEQPYRLRLKGGTNATMAPQYEYWERVFWPTLRDRFGVPDEYVEARVVQRGYYPRGGGEVEVWAAPLEHPLKPVLLTKRGEVTKILIRSFCSGTLPLRFAEETADAARIHLYERLQGVSIETDILKESNAVGSGLGILIVATTSTGCRFAGSSMNSPKMTPADVGTEAAMELCQTLGSGGCVDEWMQDQLILYAALADGTSEILTGSLTLHTQTAIEIAEEMAGVKFEIMKVDSSGVESPIDREEYSQRHKTVGKHLIRCRGIGFLNS